MVLDINRPETNYIIHEQKIEVKVDKKIKRDVTQGRNLCSFLLKEARHECVWERENHQEKKLTEFRWRSKQGAHRNQREVIFFEYLWVLDESTTVSNILGTRNFF